MQSSASGEIVIPEDSQSNLRLLERSPFESSAILPPLVLARPPLAPTPPAFAPPPAAALRPESLPPPPPPKGLADLQAVARQVLADLEEMRAEALAATRAREVLNLEREQLSAERKTLELDRAGLERAHAALAKLSGSFADARATLLEQVRVEVAMECEVRLSAQRRELVEDRERIERELEDTRRRLTRAQGQLVRSTEWLREEGATATESEAKAPVTSACSSSRAPAPRRRTRRRF